MYLKICNYPFLQQLQYHQRNQAVQDQKISPMLERETKVLFRVCVESKVVIFD